ncbi:MAG: hypothetical protein ACKVP0_27775 [Pirellulaceae bacterium]
MANGPNWAMIAAIGGAIAVLFLLAAAIGVPLLLKGFAPQQSAATPVNAASPTGLKRTEVPDSPTSAARASTPAPSSSTSSASSSPTANSILPTETVDPAQGEWRTFGEGRFQLWVPTKSPPTERDLAGGIDDKAHSSEFELPSGAILKVLVMSGSSATHEKEMIDTYQKLGGSPKSPLEVPTSAITHEGVAGYSRNLNATKHIKAARGRVFYHAERAISFGCNGTDSEVFTPEIDYFLQSLKFGAPVEN